MLCIAPRSLCKLRLRRMLVRVACKREVLPTRESPFATCHSSHLHITAFFMPPGTHVLHGYLRYLPSGNLTAVYCAIPLPPQMPPALPAAGNELPRFFKAMLYSFTASVTVLSLTSMSAVSIWQL